eukprot:3221493-Alexandrium_andersonii.AAC.1
MGRTPSRRGMSSASASASTSRGQQGQPPSERAAKRLLPQRAPQSLAFPEEPADEHRPLSGRPALVCLERAFVDSKCRFSRFLKFSGGRARAPASPRRSPARRRSW